MKLLSRAVGYGDIVPHTKGGKLFATVYILVAGTILLNNMSMISMIPLELRRRRTEMAVLNQVSWMQLVFGTWLLHPISRMLTVAAIAVW